MKSITIYYVCDDVAEAIVGSFEAPNDLAAKRNFNSMLERNEKLASIKESLSLFAANNSFPVFETYDEVIEKNHCSILKVDGNE